MFIHESASNTRQTMFRFGFYFTVGIYRSLVLTLDQNHGIYRDTLNTSHASINHQPKKIATLDNSSTKS